MLGWRIDRGPIWSEFDRLQRGVDELFTALTGYRKPTLEAPWRQARIFPLLNLKEIENSYVVTAEIPGMRTEDLEIKIEGDTLTLKGERKPHELNEGASYHRRERATGTFQRSLTLPTKIDSENVNATYKDGVLTVTLQKEKEALPKQIPVKTE
ncbi:MAG TPA: Hsp20/alpha crystallin family protein [Desulfomonilaceae bacterium]|nr:Hsp20/alpha crystallin family protein [Desulfomonilaceae bacterium]